MAFLLKAISCVVGCSSRKIGVHAKTKTKTKTQSKAQTKKRSKSKSLVVSQSFPFHRGLREVGVIVLLALGLFLLLSLGSYSIYDPSWRSATAAPAMNNGGVVGAWLADGLFSLLGVLAWCVPVFALGSAVRWMVPSQRDSIWLNASAWSMSLVMVRGTGAVCVLLGGASLASLHLSGLGWQLPSSAGGILGESFGGWVVSGFNKAGATLVLTALVFIGLSVLEVTWIRSSLMAIRSMGSHADGWKDRTYHWWTKQRQRWSAYRLERQNAARAAREQSAWAKPASTPRAGKKVKKSDEPKTRIEPVISDGNPVEASGAAKIASQTVTPKPVKKSKRAALSRQRKLFSDGVASDGALPSLHLLDPETTGGAKKGYSSEDLHSMSQLLEIKLQDFNIQATVEAVLPGPVITRFEIQLAPGIKVSRIANLAKDLARSLAVISVRVVEVIPGKTTVGIEIPNAHREVIKLSEVLTSKTFDDCNSHLTLALGKDISGQPVVANLEKMPHLLVAGTTGSGKSVGLNAMLMSMLYKATPQDLRLIMIDPKMLELSVYDDIPHLLTPVVTDMKEAANALRWCVAEMERRYKLMASLGVRNLAGYNRKVSEALERGEPLADPMFPETAEMEQIPTLGVLPKIVVVIDEFADMMMIVGKKVEELIARIAQKARAAGIHLILATQRPSVDVITGLIKANVPARVGFQVSSKVDSRTILDQGGAEQLLGYGDMLYLPPGTGMPERVHGAFVDDDEVHRVCDDWRQRGQPDYLEEILAGEHEVMNAAAGGQGEGAQEQDELYDEAVQFVLESRRASISAVQRRLRIGYNRSARLIEAMEAAGVVSKAGSGGSREVLPPSPVS